MIYRFYTCVNIRKRIDSRTYSSILDREGVTTAHEFEACAEKISLPGSWPHCQLYRASEMPAKEIEWHLIRVKIKNGVFPDLLSQTNSLLISERAKAVIEAVDGFEHQYCPINITDKAGQPINALQYYQMSVRRTVEIDELGLPMPKTKHAHRPMEYLWIPTIHAHKDLYQSLETLPIWRTKCSKAIHYFNEELVTALRAQNLSGLDLYSQYESRKDEALSYVL